MLPRKQTLKETKKAQELPCDRVVGIPLVLEQKMDIGSPSDVLMASFSVAAVLVHRAQVLP